MATTAALLSTRFRNSAMSKTLTKLKGLQVSYNPAQKCIEQFRITGHYEQSECMVKLVRKEEIDLKMASVQNFFTPLVASRSVVLGLFSSCRFLFRIVRSSGDAS